MKLVRVFFLFLLILWVLLAVLFLAPPPEHATGVPHPEVDSMLHSGESLALRPLHRWLGWGFGMGIIGIFAFFLLLGTRRRGGWGRLKGWLAAGFLLYGAVFSALVFAHWDYALHGRVGWFLGFPLPTAWMLFGMLFAPGFFVALYVLGFRRWIYEEVKNAP